MNNRLKFRVWDKRQNEYIESPNPMPLLQANGLLAYFNDNPKAMDFYVVEFSTGLKDKNGKLVFEGDVIVPVYVNPLGRYKEDDFDETNKKIVKFKNGCFGFETETSFYTIDNFIPREDGEYICNHGNKLIYSDYVLFKVIGNIHENPELLGGK